MTKVAVIGAGTMGNGIAHTFAQFGYQVSLIDLSQDSLNKGIATITKNLDRQVAKEKISTSDKESTLNNIKGYTTDICVPISNLVEAIQFAETEIQNYGLRAPMVGHVGDGNFHVAIQYDPKDKDSYKVIREFSDKLIQKALDLEGTVTGEHGVGIHKKEYLVKQHPDNLPYMKLIKKSFDPNNIMNPGKVFD